MRFWQIFWLSVTFVVLAYVPAHAHEGRPLYIEITETGEQRFQLRWKIPPVIADNQLPIIRLTGADCQIEAGTERAQLMGGHLYRCKAISADTENKQALQVELYYPGGNPVLSTLVMLRTAAGTEHSIIAGPDETKISLPRADKFWAVAAQYSIAGLDHIKGGYDHLLFVFCLILIAGTMQRVLITVTGFTLGHSLTLGLSALGSWSLPPPFVEPLIAFSIVMLAAEVARKSGTSLVYRRPALVASGFGLLHGFGFGGALADIGLPENLQLQALGFFNIGVEIGQVLFVLMVYGLYRLGTGLSRTINITANPLTLAPMVIYPVGVIAAFWTFERTLSIWA